MKTSRKPGIITAKRGPMYHCANCGAERCDETRLMVDGVLHLRVIYECSSYRELRRVGHNWRHIGDVFTCKPLKMRMT